MFVQEEYEAAKEAFKRSLAIDEAAFGPEDRKVAEDLLNFARVLEIQVDVPTNYRRGTLG